MSFASLRRTAAALIVASLVSAPAGSFANTAWKGTTSGNWSDTTNWVSGLPNVTSGVLFNINSTGTLVTNQDIPNLTVLSIGNQAVPNTAGTTPVSISGLGITIDSGGINNNGATQDMTISTDLTLSATQGWSQATGRTMTVNGTNLFLSNSTTSHTLTITIPSAGGTVNIDSKISDSSVGGAAASNLTFASTGSSNAGAVVRISGANTYTGNTDLNGRGFLYQIGSNSPFGAATSTVIVDTSGAVNTFQAINGDHSFNNPITMNLGFNFTGSNSLTLGGNITSTQGRAIAHNLAAGASATFNGDITMGASGAAAGTFTTSVIASATTASGELIFNGAIKEAAGVTSGLLVQLTNGSGAAFSEDQMNGQNTYSGGTLLSGGGSMIQIGSSSTMSGPTIVSGPLGTGPLTFSNGTTLPKIEAIGAPRTVANNVILSSSGIIQGGQNLTLSGSVTNSGNDRTLQVNNTATTTLSGPVYLSEASGTGRTLILGGTGNLTISGNISNFNGSGTSGNLTIQDPGASNLHTITLSGNNTYSGNTTLNIRSGLNINSPTALGTSTLIVNSTTSTTFDNTSGTLVTLTNANPINLSGGSPTFVGTNDLSFGNNTVTMNGASRTITTNASTLTLGAIGEDAAPRSFTKAGAGTLALIGGGSYSGGTTISAGTLLANNMTGSATGSGAIVINAGTLGGNGAVSGGVTANSGGSVSPGTPTANIAALATGALTLNSGSTFVYEMNTNASLASAADLLNANGALTIAASGALLSITDSGNTVVPVNTKFTLISYTGAWSGNAFNGFADDSTVTIGSNQYVLNYNDTSGGSNFGGGSGTSFVTLTAVPEAGSFILGSLVCLAAGVVLGGKRFFRNPAVEA